MARIPGIFFIFSAFVLNLLTSISLPYIASLDITRTHFNQGVILSDMQTNQVTELRFGVWAPCFYNEDDQKTCFASGHGYNTSISNEQKTANVTINYSWTQGLAVHPVAAGVTFVALLLSLYQNLTATLLASIASFLAAILTFIAFANDIALFVYLRHQVNKLPGVQGKTTPGPGFWFTLASFTSLLLGGFIVCFGRRSDSQSARRAHDRAKKSPGHKISPRHKISPGHKKPKPSKN